MGLLADGRRRREPQTITRPVPVLIRPAQAATSGTLTRPCRRGRDGLERPARLLRPDPGWALHPQLTANAGSRERSTVVRVVAVGGSNRDAGAWHELTAIGAG